MQFLNAMTFSWNFNEVTSSFVLRASKGYLKRQTFTIPPSFSLPQLQGEEELKREDMNCMALADFLIFDLYLAVLYIRDDQHHRSEHLAALRSTSVNASFFLNIISSADYTPSTLSWAASSRPSSDSRQRCQNPRLVIYPAKTVSLCSA